jgi:ABC-type bacteriocin/lantibiotic exporter with double-glycine peptidase domain
MFPCNLYGDDSVLTAELSFTPMTSFRRSDLLKRIVRLFQSHRKSLWRTLSIGLFIQGLSMVSPYCEQLLIDRVYRKHNIALLDVFVLSTIAITTATMLIGALRPYANSLLSMDMHRDVSVSFYDHVQHLPVHFFDKHRTGEITSRFHDIRSALRVFVSCLQTIATNVLYLILVPPFLFFRNPELATIALSSIPVTAWLIYKQAVASYRNALHNAELASEVLAFETEMFRNVRWLKTHTLERYCYQRFKELIARMADLQRFMHKSTRSYNVAVGMTRSLSTGVCVWTGWHLIASGRLTLGQFIAFMTYVTYLYNPIAEIASSAASIQETLVTIERVCDCLEQPSENATWGGQKLALIQRSLKVGDIELRDVVFGYLPGSVVFDRVNVVFRQGQVNALIGPSGCGKTTLLRLLVGFHHLNSGSIMIEGVDISQVRLADLRAHVSVVWQDATLLTGSLWDNLTIGNGAVSVARVQHIVELCQLDAFITSLPSGYATQVGEGGVALSAGQRQRVAIAQALLRSSPVILLDEATANIDVETERKLMEALFAESGDRLIVCVTHRLSTASLADKVFMCHSANIADVTQNIKWPCRSQEGLVNAATGPRVTGYVRGE